MGNWNSWFHLLQARRKAQYEERSLWDNLAINFGQYRQDDSKLGLTLFILRSSRDIAHALTHDKTHKAKK